MSPHVIVAELFALARRFGSEGLKTGAHPSDRLALARAASACAQLGLSIEKEFRLVDERRMPCARCEGLRLIEIAVGVEIPCTECHATGVQQP